MSCRAARNIKLYFNKSLKTFQIQSRSLRTVSSFQRIGTKTQPQNSLSFANTHLLSQGRALHVSFRLFEERVVKTPPFADSVSEGDMKYGKAVGDQVQEDETVCEIETDKTSMPVPAPVAGTLLAYLVEDGSKVVANQDLFKIQVGGGGGDGGASKAPEPEPIASTPPASAPAAGGSGELKVVSSPPFADSVSEGDVRFQKAVGDEVAEDELVMEIETDKTSMPITAPTAGVIDSFLIEDGAKITANTPLFKLRTGGFGTKKSAPEPAAPSKVAPPPSTPVSSPIPTKAPTIPPLPSQPLTSKPAASVTPQVASRPPPPADGSKPVPGLRTEERVKMNRMRLRIAQRLKDAQNTCAMLTTFNEVDMSNIIEMRNSYKDAFVKKHGVKLGFMSPFLKASAYALMDQPSINAVIDDTEIVYRDYVDISVAVATPKGLVVPVLRNVQVQDCGEIEKNLFDLGEKAKAGHLAIEDMDGGTFTISNGGVFGSLMGTPIINPPQSAILGMHGIFDRPVAIKGEVKIRPMMYLALTYDHRLVDGREAVTFLRKIKAAIEDPRTILLDL